MAQFDIAYMDRRITGLPTFYKQYSTTTPDIKACSNPSNLISLIKINDKVEATVCVKDANTRLLANNFFEINPHMDDFKKKNPVVHGFIVQSRYVPSHELQNANHLLNMGAELQQDDKKRVENFIPIESKMKLTNSTLVYKNPALTSKKLAEDREYIEFANQTVKCSLENMERKDESTRAQDKDIALKELQLRQSVNPFIVSRKPMKITEKPSKLGYDSATRKINWENEYTDNVISNIQKAQTAKPNAKLSRQNSVDENKRTTPRKKKVEVVDVRHNSSARSTKIDLETEKLKSTLRNSHFKY